MKFNSLTINSLTTHSLNLLRFEWNVVVYIDKDLKLSITLELSYFYLKIVKRVKNTAL